MSLYNYPLLTDFEKFKCCKCRRAYLFKCRVNSLRADKNTDGYKTGQVRPVPFEASSFLRGFKLNEPGVLVRLPLKRATQIHLSLGVQATVVETQQLINLFFEFPRTNVKLQRLHRLTEREREIKSSLSTPTQTTTIITTARVCCNKKPFS